MVSCAAMFRLVKKAKLQRRSGSDELPGPGLGKSQQLSTLLIGVSIIFY